MVNITNYDAIEGIAIVGMAGRFPNAKNIEEFWRNLQDGVESISDFTNEEVISEGIDPALLNDTNYVKASGVLEDIDCFDALFFDINPKEAEVTDPQHRLFLECASEALENAGYDSTRCDSRIGVFAGASLNNYLSFNVNSDQVGSAKSYQKLIGNDKDFLTTRVSYKLNLSGPSITIQTACSTSLVATTVACQSLLNYQCDMALAGGVSIRVPQKTGYLYEPGGTLSPDGHCRAFDAKAQGTTIGNGVGVVLLKRLSDAIADGDCIYAVIKGSAINNDGSLKVGYTAPSVDGQGAVIAEAMMLAGVEPETINYIEAHGTGTTLGDPVEIAALSQVFRRSTKKKSFCAIGSVKTNIGHLDVASGVVGLIKTALALKHKLIPPSLNFEQPNPEIDFANSPFYVNTTLTEWKTGVTPRRAGVSSLGIGGTNAHVILEEAPALPASSSSRPWQLLVLSAKTDSALETATTNLVQYLKQHPDITLADVAHTLQVGRREFNHRCILVCADIEDATSALQQPDPQRVFTHLLESGDRSITFMFPGQGAQYVDMGKELYQTEPIFQEQVDLCCELLQPHLGLDLRSLIYPGESESEAAAQKLQQTDITQPALFVIEYALAQLWMSWGISPGAMIGHSIGEYVAACLAGVMSLEDALALVAARGRLMQQLPSGAMLSIPLPEEEVVALLDEKLSLAASNAPALCVVSGTHNAIDAFQNKLQDRGIDCRRLHTSHAFHSPMMEPILEAFQKEVSKVKLHPPKIPFVSNVTGIWITAEQATDSNYWVKHLRQTVRFAAGIYTLLQEPNHILLEVGPGRTLCSFTKKHLNSPGLSSLRHPKEKQSDITFLLNTLGKLWLYGVQVDWSRFYTNEYRHRLPLPTYPFERQRYWIEPEVSLHEKLDISDWFYIPSWKRLMPPQPFSSKLQATQTGCWLIFIDECGLGEQIVQRLTLEGNNAIIVRIGEQFSSEIVSNQRVYTINPRRQDDYYALIKELSRLEVTPNRILHLWNLTLNSGTELTIESLERCETLGFYSLVFLAQALAEQQRMTNPMQIGIVSNNLQEVTGSEVLDPGKAFILGPCKVIQQEYSNIACCSIDIIIPETENWQQEKLVDRLLAEFTVQLSDRVVAYRGNYRWVQTFEPVRLDRVVEAKPQLRERGVYLITGGLGGVGLFNAEYLAKTVQAKLILIGRSAFPNQDEWSQWLSDYGVQDSVSRKILKLQELEVLGAEILIVKADVTNREQMEAAITQANNRFGQINGVIHNALEDKKGLIAQKTLEIGRIVFTPKIIGTIILDNLFKNVELDFFVLTSSQASVIGGIGLVEYTAKNAFLDAFAYYSASKHGKFIKSINWDIWNTPEWMAKTKLYRVAGLKLEETGLTLEEGMESFERILFSSTMPQIVVSKSDFNNLINQKLINLKDTLNSLEEESSKVSRVKKTHSRPDLRNAYVAPRNEIERTLTEIWQEIFSIEQVGIYDNFFELGGDSLLATIVISQLRKTLKIEVPYKSFFDEPTITKLALVVEEIFIEELEELEQLSKN
ncbi:type I polyketide synthase [Nostoc sp. 'Peltigera membranacea cyanobiont' N6]|uniref:type I polyketide synthase n=1 Tax=Nostoc sp. 'Peltigera membranacea cyanobiont' N6 TaxID=1261031 RepID=UPI000CF32E26|nr:type I polyketide synthase [Nostoc sp. 'Peltigera membranacea cyanobiont' N6]AVH67247.1 polyketide synthase [Nostoc sp. 'Peltigera membranacea cyanobiont' N6]